MNNRTEEPKLQTAIDMFKRTHRMHMRVFDKYIDTLEIRRSQHGILRYLWHNNSGVSQKEIAKHFEVSTAAVAVTLKKLEDMGYVKRATSKQDGRFNSVSITEKGAEVVERTFEEFWRIDTAMFENLTEQELESFTISLEKMHAQLKEMYEK